MAPDAVVNAAEEALILLIKNGALLPVMVFGTTDCCAHGPFDPSNPAAHRDCVSVGHGLCDTFGPHTVGSDCNRAERYLMRPSDELMTPRVLEALALEEDPIDWEPRKGVSS